jgi:hypothetical protein
MVAYCSPYDDDINNNFCDYKIEKTEEAEVEEEEDDERDERDEAVFDHEMDDEGTFCTQDITEDEDEEEEVLHSSPRMCDYMPAKLKFMSTRIKQK